MLPSENVTRRSDIFASPDLSDDYRAFSGSDPEGVSPSSQFSLSTLSPAAAYCATWPYKRSPERPARPLMPPVLDGGAWEPLRALGWELGLERELEVVVEVTGPKRSSWTDVVGVSVMEGASFSFTCTCV